MQGKSVLELGSGVGFLGLIIAVLQLTVPSRPARVRLTDVNPLVLKRCDENILLPCSACRCLRIRAFERIQNCRQIIEPPRYADTGPGLARRVSWT